MSLITYHVGNHEFSFHSRIQLKEIPMLAVEQNLIEEIEADIHKRSLPHRSPMHDISIIDDNGIKAEAKDFSEVESLKIKQIKQ